MGLVSEMYRIIYSFIPTQTHTHTDKEKPAWQCSEIL
jgi:hypothetical protein